MGVSNLTVGDMIVILDHYTSDHYINLFQSKPELSGIITALHETKEILIESRDVLDSLSPEETKEIKKQIRIVDKAHDRFYRALWYLLIALEHRGGDEGVKAKMLRMTLFPFGLGIVKKRHSEEAGEAFRLEKQIEDSEIRASLEAIIVGEETALQWAEDVVVKGKEINTLLSSLPKPDSVEERPGNKQVRARRAFFKFIKALEATSNLAFSSGSAESKKSIADIMYPLEQQIAKVDK